MFRALHIHWRALTRSSGAAAPRRVPLHPSIGTVDTLRSFTSGKNDSGKKKKDKKHNFDREILQPAQKGRLVKKHSSGIPKLAGRPPKANLAPPGGRAGKRIAAQKRMDLEGLMEDGFNEFDVAEIDEAAAERAGAYSKWPKREADSDDDEAAYEKYAKYLAAAKEEGDDSDEEGYTDKVGYNPYVTVDAGDLEDGSDGEGDWVEETPLETSLSYVMDDYDPYFAFELMDDKKYYWREEEFESLVDGPDPNDGKGRNSDEVLWTDFDKGKSRLLEDDLADILDSLNERGTFDEETLRAYDKENSIGLTYDDFENEDEDEKQKGKPKFEEKGVNKIAEMGKVEPMDPDDWFFDGAYHLVDQLRDEEMPSYDDIEHWDSEDDEKYESDDDESDSDEEELPDDTLELAPHEPGIEGFQQAMLEHPTKIARVSLLRPHPAGLREPKPIFPKDRRPHPPIEFVESYNRFIYVTGLPPLIVNGERGELANPVHRSYLEKLVARLAQVDSTQVWPVNTTSAFVGFFTPRAMANAVHSGPSKKAVSLPPKVRRLSEVKDTKNPFKDTDADRVIQFSLIPPFHSPSSISRALFPPDTELETVYGAHIDPSKDVVVASNTAWFRFPSADEAAAAAASTVLQKRLEKVGLYRVRYFLARRELVHKCFSGPAKDEEERVKGPRLIVDGDMPSKEFFQSHPRCIHVSNLDPAEPSISEKLTELFQPFSEWVRYPGSVEPVTCAHNLPTDRAYVGFDVPGEAEACVKKCNGKIRMGDRTLFLRLVDDRIVPNRGLYRAEKRPARSVEELWDDLENWEKYVDPADIEYLEQHGVSKCVMDEQLKRMRLKNPTFGPLDHCLRSEAIEPDKKPGEIYKEVVQTYVQVLKDCVATREDPGPVFLAGFENEEDIDYSVFDEWEKRKAEIERLRARS